MMKLEGLSIVGRGRLSRAGSPTPAVNPMSGDVLEPGYHWASAQDVDSAARSAARAFTEYSRWGGARKASFLRRIAEAIEAVGTEIQERAHQETALPMARLQGETARTCGQLRLFADLVEQGWWVDARIDHANPDRAPLPKPDVRSMVAPLGPVAVFSPCNFPLAFSVAGGDTASALAAGCPVIVKAHRGHLGTSEMVALCVKEAAEACGAPDGVFSLLFGDGRTIGTALVQHPLVKAVGFTGSTAGGRALMDAAAARPQPIPVYAEMGSINPVFLLPGALRENGDAIATGLHASVTLGVGQFCTNPGLVFVDSGADADAFLKKLGQLMDETPPGTMLTAGLCSSYRNAVEKIEQRPGVRRAGGRLADPGAGSAQAGTALLVTDADTFLDEPALTEEMFGPATLVVQCAGSEQMIRAARMIQGQLTSSIHATRDEMSANPELLAVLSTKAGRLIWNGFPTGVEVCHAMTHGGPYPATSDGRSTSVGSRAILRFVRQICFQDFPDEVLPDELKASNPLGGWRLVDGEWRR